MEVTELASARPADWSDCGFFRSRPALGNWAAQFSHELEGNYRRNPLGFNVFMALLGSGFNDIWRDLGQQQATAAFLVVDAIAVLIYASFIVIRRHSPNFEPGTGVY